MGTSMAYERFLDVHGWSWGDVATRVLGYAGVEALVTIIRGKP